MADNMEEEQQQMAKVSDTSPSPPPPSSMLLVRLMSKRRTWVCLFVAVYTILLSSTWNLLKSILSWYESTSSTASSSSGWPALYASVLLGALLGLLSMAAALAVVVPATLVTWITVLVLLTFCGKPRKALLVEGKKLTAEITGSVGKILIKEGNVVAAVCVVLGYFALVRKNREEGG
uniref:Pyrroline-5-carboxylate reductase n=1 Tax=Davidia involucrata TaxID=16924 RepID=A0A5B6YYE8_DAVIN